MNKQEDRVDNFCLKAINILLLKNPERTVLGILLGVVYSFFANIFNPLLSKIQYIDMSKAPSGGWIPLGIICVNLPIIISHLFRKPIINEKVDEITKLIEAGCFTEIERRTMYRNLVSECIKNANLNKNFSEEFQLIQQKISKPTTSQ